MTSPDEWYDFLVTLASVLSHTSACLLFTLGLRLIYGLWKRISIFAVFSERLNVMTVHVVATPLSFRVHVHLNIKR